MEQISFPGSVTIGAMGGVLCAIAVLILCRANSTPIWQVARETSQQIRVPGVKYGAEPNFEVDIIPDAVESSGGRERVSYHAELTSNHKSKGTIAWTTRLVDDIGNVTMNLDRGTSEVLPNGVAATKSVWVDAPDGFYTLRVRAAIHSSNGEDVFEGVQYLYVTKGKVREVTSDQWYAKSRALLARAVSVGGAQ